MKRVGNLYESIIAIDNLVLADKKARKGKRKQYGVQKHIKNEKENLSNLNELLKHRKYKTSEYSIFEIIKPKHRIIARLPYYPDKIIHRAIMNKVQDIFTNTFTADTYSCIKGKGIHKASFNLTKALQNDSCNKYCLKLDVKKFYQNIDHTILKVLLRKKFKDRELLNLLDEMIDSYPDGLPLGSILSQNLANYYLTYFDHWIKEKLKVKVYFRYMDDMVILSNNKEELHKILRDIEDYLKDLKLEVKTNWQVFPVEVRGIDFVGYVHRKDYTLLRKSIKKSYIKNKNKINHWGWLKHADTINLRRRYEHN